MAKPYTSLESCPALLTSNDLALVLGVSDQTARRYLQDGDVSGGVRIKRRWYLPKKKLLEVLGLSSAETWDNAR